MKTKTLEKPKVVTVSIRPIRRVVTFTLNPVLSDEAFIKAFSAEWSAADHCTTDTEYKISNNDSVKLYNKPFKICVMQDFVYNKQHMEQMVAEMYQIEWQRKQMDLYEFHQTTDLINLPISSTKHTLRRFYNMLVNDMLPWMKRITGLNLTHVSASCSLYNFGDYLLVHDDLLSDRQIAFVYYLTPWFENWTEEMGGALELFECDPVTNQPKYPIVRKFHPRNNQFVFFKVCQKSFHQVGEVTNLVYPRLTINGWFHGPLPKAENNGTTKAGDSHTNTTLDSANGTNEDAQTTLNHAPLNDDLNLTEWINATYLKRRVKSQIHQHIEEKSEASLESFLIPDFYDVLVTEFKENTELEWVLEGPADQRKYESLKFSAHSTGPPKDLYTLFTSKVMFGLLHEYTELDFDGENAKTPTCSVQICRFTQGCYTLLGDSSTFSESALDVILFFNAKDEVGKITYLSPECFNEYNTTADTDATISSVDVAEACGSSNLTCSTNSSPLVLPAVRTNSLLNEAKRTNWKGFRNNLSKPASSSCGSPNLSETIDEDTSVGTEQDAEVSAIFKNAEILNAMYPPKKTVVSRKPIKHKFNDDDDDSTSSSSTSDSSDTEKDEESEHDEDDLAQEDVLLTVHPKNNALNLVYRLSGQTKFVKYISKNCIKPDEYVYILFATFKE